MTIAYVGSTYATDGTVFYTPTAGNDLIVQVVGIDGPSALTSLTDSVGGETVLTDFAYTWDSGSQVGIGIFRVHNCAAGSHHFTPVWGTAPTDYFTIVVEASGIPGIDTTAGTLSLATGNSATPTTANLTTTANGDFLIAVMGQDHGQTLGSWTNGFTTAQSFASGCFASGYLVQATAASVNAGIGSTPSEKWAAVLVAYGTGGGGGGGSTTPAAGPMPRRKFILP